MSTVRTCPSKTQRSTQVAATVVALAAMLAAGLWLRLHAIEAKSLWIDEGVSAAFTRLGWYDLARILWRREANMTLYYLLLRAWTQMGDSVAMIRGLSVIPSLASIPVMYALGRRLFSRGTGLAAALLLMVNAYSVRYAQEARSYSLVAFLVTLATYCFVRAVESGRKRDWNWYVVSSVLAMYAHFFAVLVVLAHWVSLKALAGRATKKSSTEAGAGAAFRRAGKLIALWTSPLWFFIVTTGAGPVKWIHRPGARDLYAFVEQLAGNGGVPLVLLYAACAAVAIIAAARLLRADSGAEAWHHALPVLWFAVPVTVALLFSLARPVFLPRYLIICLPALVLMAARGVTLFRQHWLALPVLIAICWFAVGGVRSYYRQDFDLGRQDFRAATAHILQCAQPGDVVLFHNGQGRFPYSYYADHIAGNKPSIIFPGTDTANWRSFMGSIKPELLSKLAQGHQRLWVVLTDVAEPGGEEAGTRQIRAVLGTTHRLAATRRFSYLRVDLYEPGDR